MNGLVERFLFFRGYDYLISPCSAPVQAKRFGPKFFRKASGIFKLDEQISDSVFLTNLYVNEGDSKER